MSAVVLPPFNLFIRQTLIHLHFMKNRISITSIFLMMTVLFAILFQSFDSYKHLEEQFSEIQCHHKYEGSNSEITHQHHNFVHCAVCDFTFSSYFTPGTFFFCSQFAQIEIPYFSTSSETPLSFSGSAYSLRGPPSIIV